MFPKIEVAIDGYAATISSEETKYTLLLRQSYELWEKKAIPADKFLYEITEIENFILKSQRTS